MDDLISRKALCEYALNQKDKSITPNDIMRFPSAQPETHEERTETHGVCLDTISRKEAIDALDKIFPADPMRNDYTQGITCGAALATEYIKQLPSAQSERQKGEWIDYTEDGYVECPFCHSATNCDGNKDELHFCFSCGADMRGKQDG